MEVHIKPKQIIYTYRVGRDPTARTTWMSVRQTLQCVITKRAQGASTQWVHTLVHVIQDSMTWMESALVCTRLIVSHKNST